MHIAYSELDAHVLTQVPLLLVPVDVNDNRVRLLDKLLPISRGLDVATETK
jgi:hypothetical protein